MPCKALGALSDLGPCSVPPHKALIPVKGGMYYLTLNGSLTSMGGSVLKAWPTRYGPLLSSLGFMQYTM
jgi:hypothetical protein